MLGIAALHPTVMTTCAPPWMMKETSKVEGSQQRSVLVEWRTYHVPNVTRQTHPYPGLLPLESAR